MKQVICLILSILGTIPVFAQQPDRPLRKFVVADIETRVPLRNAVVSSTDGYRDTTNYRGICLIPETFDTLSVARQGYLTERLTQKEAKDSTFLIPSGKSIKEVTVWGKNDQSGIMRGINDAINEGTAKRNSQGGNINIMFDFASMIDKRYRKDMKNLRKTKQIFNEMDKLDDDPIVDAYKKALEEKRLESERAKAAEERKNQNDAQ
jgi:hypothetical protein